MDALSVLGPFSLTDLLVNCLHDHTASHFDCEPTGAAIRKQNRQNRAIRQRSSQISLDQPDEMDNTGGSAEVNQPVQPLPALAAQAADPTRSRGQSQRQQQRPGG